MKKISVLLLLCFCCFLNVQAKSKDKATENQKKELEKLGMDSTTVNLMMKLSALKFQEEGSVTIAEGKATIQIPEGFKFLDSKQSHFVVEELWGNPKQDLEGMLLPKASNLLDDTWAFIIKYNNEGHIDDSDAKGINYNEMMVDLKKEVLEDSPKRKMSGYDTFEIIGWASTPYYDEQKKVLHWAKEIKFENAESNTLNYDVRLLSREGMVSLNAVGDISKLDEIKSQIPNVFNAFSFTSGNAYSDYNSGIDKVAAVGIGGLVAGKVLAKVGFFAIILKYIKVIIVAVIAGGSWIWRKITNSREDSQFK